MSDIHEASQAKILIPPPNQRMQELGNAAEEIALLRAVVKAAKKYRRYECDMYRAELDAALDAMNGGAK